MTVAGRDQKRRCEQEKLMARILILLARARRVRSEMEQVLVLVSQHHPAHDAAVRVRAAHLSIRAIDQ